MFSPIVTIFIFFVVIALTAVVFFGWLVYTIIRLIVGGVSSVLMPEQRTRSVTAGVRCGVAGCQTVNPGDARFCRRCGHGLPAAQRVQVRRAAVW